MLISSLLSSLFLLPALVFAGTCWNGGQDGSAPWYVKSSSGQDSVEYDDVNYCVNTVAASGDTVNLPAGSVTWGNTLTITKGVTLQGAGMDSTTVTSSGGTIIVAYIPANPSLNESFRLTGVTLDGNGRSVIGVYVGNSSTSDTITNIRLDHNKIHGCANKCFQPIGMIYGLIDNNIFMGDSGVVGKPIMILSGNNDYSWEQPVNIGTADSLYIEDNTFSGTTEGWYIIQSNEGTRWVFRNNTADMSNGGQPLDVHGNQATNYSDIPISCLNSSVLYNNARSGVITEVYGNTFTNQPTSARIFQARGGQTFVWNNNSSGPNANQPFFVMWEEDASLLAYGPCSPLKTDYPGLDPLIAYAWENNFTKVGYSTSRAYIQYNNVPSLEAQAIMIPEQIGYWADTQRGSTTATSYWRSDLHSDRNLTTCTAEDVYWETDTKKLYRCTATNTWTFVYKPYIYPHPLQGISNKGATIINTIGGLNAINMVGGLNVINQ